MHWVDDWPLIGKVRPDGVCEPVAGGAKPDVGKSYPVAVPATSDEFDAPALGLQWQWNHNPLDTHWSLSDRPGYLRLRAAPAGELHDARNTLTQKLADPACSATVELHLDGMKADEAAGLSVFGDSYGWIGVTTKSGQPTLAMVHNHGGWRGKGQTFRADGPAVTAKAVWLRATVGADQKAGFAFSLDGTTYQPLGEKAQLYFDWWKGSKFALFCYTTDRARDNPHGYADFGWFHYESK